MNGTNNPTTLTSQDTNGHASELHLIRGVDGEPSIEELESELDIVQDGQVELGDLLSRVVQQIYAELTEMAETFVHYREVVIAASYLYDRTQAT